MKMKITYENGFGPVVCFDYENAEQLIDSFRKGYGENSAARIKIISVEKISAEESAFLEGVEESKAEYFKKYGTANE